MQARTARERFQQRVAPNDIRPGQREMLEMLRATFPLVFRVPDRRQRITPEQHTRSAVFSSAARAFIGEFGRNLKRHVHRLAFQWAEQSPCVDLQLMALAGRVQDDTLQAAGLHLTIPEALFVARTAQRSGFHDHPHASLDASTLILLPCLLEAACETLC